MELKLGIRDWGDLPLKMSLAEMKLMCNRLVCLEQNEGPENASQMRSEVAGSKFQTLCYMKLRNLSTFKLLIDTITAHG